MMKQLTLIAVALLVFCGVASAQQSKSDETLEFRPHWSLNLQAGAAYTIGELEFSKFISPAAQVSAAYNFHHAMGVRFGLSGWEGKGAVVVTDQTYKFNFLQLNADYVLDLANLFGGFKHNRAVSPYAFAGIGGAYGFNNDEAGEFAKDYSGVLTNYWEGSKMFLVGRVGVGANFWVAKNFALSLELNGNCFSEKLNSKATDGVNTDWQYKLLAGISYRIGGNTRPSAAYAAKVAAEKEAMELARKAEEARLAAEKAAAEKAAAEKAAAEKAAAEKAAAEKAAAEKAAAERAALAKANTINVFFTIGSANINKEEDKKIETLVEWLKANPEFTISIVGHADKATGTSKWNMKLSENRAKNVKERLMKLGIPAERINSAFMGDTANQFSENNKNRVVICQVE